MQITIFELLVNIYDMTSSKPNIDLLLYVIIISVSKLNVLNKLNRYYTIVFYIPLLLLVKELSIIIMAAAPVIIAASVKHTATLIFLHGLGDTGQGWASAMAAVRPPYVKVICPTAHTIPVTLNAGYRMPSWFDLKTLEVGGPEDEEGIRVACRLIQGLVSAEINSGVSPGRIILGGFSQGGALALYSALTSAQPLAGCVALSCWLPLHRTFPAAITAPETKVLLCHGDCDPVVPYRWGQMTASILKAQLKHCEFKSYSGLTHSSSDDELSDVKRFLAATLPPM